MGGNSNVVVNAAMAVNVCSKSKIYFELKREKCFRKRVWRSRIPPFINFTSVDGCGEITSKSVDAQKRM
jgi:hypothetical protein